MDFFAALLADLPDPASVWADAYDRFPGHPSLADRWAAVVLEGQYLRARSALAALVERVKCEDALRAPDAYAATHQCPVPDLSVRIAGPAAGDLAPAVVAGADDSECSDVGRLANVGADATRHDLRGTI